MPSASDYYRNQRSQYDPGMGMDELCDALNAGLYIGSTTATLSATTVQAAIEELDIEIRPSQSILNRELFNGL